MSLPDENVGDEVRLLLIEDNPGDADLVREMLCGNGRRGVCLRHAERLESAIEQLAEEDIDLVLLDLSLPDSEGLETLLRVRAAAPDVPIVIITGSGAEEMAVEAMRSGAQDYLSKSDLSHETVARSIRHALERQQRLLANLADKVHELESAEARFRGIIENNADGILVVGLDGLVRFVNPAGEELLGRDSARVLGRPFGSPLVPGEGTELDIVRSGGEIVSVELRAVQTVWMGEEVYLVSLRDITEQKRMQSKLAETQREQLRLKDRFLSHVSHELRTPLATIHQFVSILSDGIGGDLLREQREYLDVTARNVGQLRGMVDDLLEGTRIASGQLVVDPVPLSLTEIIEETVTAAHPKAESSGIGLALEPPGPLPNVLADPQRVRQILTNLLDNAVKFTPAGGRVTVHAARDGEDGFVRVEVSDTGCGIPASDLERVFESMYQVQRSDTGSRAGLGLGLHICRELVVRHGGRIWVESREEEGSRFFFALPEFSLEPLLLPVLVRGNVALGSIALLRLRVVPATQELAPPRSAILRRVRSIVDRCLMPDRDVLLPRFSSDLDRADCWVVAKADRDGARVLARRLERQVAALESLSTDGLTVDIDTQMITSADEGVEPTPAEIVSRIARKITARVSPPC